MVKEVFWTQWEVDDWCEFALAHPVTTEGSLENKSPQRDFLGCGEWYKSKQMGDVTWVLPKREVEDLDARLPRRAEVKPSPACPPHGSPQLAPQHREASPRDVPVPGGTCPQMFFQRRPQGAAQRECSRVENGTGLWCIYQLSLATKNSKESTVPLIPEQSPAPPMAISCLHQPLFLP